MSPPHVTITFSCKVAPLTATLLVHVVCNRCELALYYQNIRYTENYIFYIAPNSFNIIISTVYALLVAARPTLNYRYIKLCWTAIDLDTTKLSCEIVSFGPSISNPALSSSAFFGPGHVQRRSVYKGSKPTHLVANETKYTERVQALADISRSALLS